MKRWLRSLSLVLVASSAWMTTGCATHTGEGAVLGSLLGAGAGALIGHAAGDSGMGAIIGAGSGAVLGGLIGNSYDAYDHGYARGYDNREHYPPPHAYHPAPRYERYEYHHYRYNDYAWRPPPRSYSYYERRTYSHHPPNYGFHYDHYRH